MNFQDSRLARWLGEKASPTLFSIFAITAAFSTYVCMYGFRKPYTAGAFEGVVDLPGFLPELSYKSVLIISQVLGYCTSKFLGIKVISEMGPEKRGISILMFIGIAWGSLALFAITPAPYNAIWLFVNGLPLGMIWGLVFGFLEGRRLTEALGAGLSASYIIASGFVKSIARWLMNDVGVPELWMPFVTGALFALPMLIAVFFLANLPPPNAEDIRLRTKREPMDGKARKAFFMSNFVGLISLTTLYVLLTAFRGFRDDFAVEIWGELGYGDEPAILTISELPVAFGVLVALGLLMKIKDNRKALIVVHGLMLGGTALVGLSTLAFQMQIIGPATWMITVGMGLYFAYVPFGSMLFDRLIATLGVVGTAGFMIYMTDAFGYLGNVALLIYKDMGFAELSWLNFFTGFAYITSIVCTALFAVSMVYFMRRTPKTPAS
jgi:hypothetical protein